MTCPLPCKSLMYADDTTISLSSKSIADLQNDLNLDLLKLQDWLHANKLSLNVVKTQSLIIGSGPNIRKIDNQSDASIQFISIFSFLGMVAPQLEKTDLQGAMQ